ncbi:MAG: hypothetical protein O7C75_01275, partial [Verrucomicrobia bacterium]|nr:hypothetical protein [Verrucomicrobiota bacterium]
TKKELLNKNYEWPTLLNVNDLKKSWIRLERCPEEIKLIKEELGTEPKPFFSPSESFYTLEKDDLGKIIELIAKYFKTFLLPVSLLEKNKKKSPVLSRVNTLESILSKVKTLKVIPFSS